MENIKNIPGEFIIELVGQKRTLKCSFGVIEKLESIMNKSIGQMLTDTMQGRVFISDVVTVIHAGLEGAKDTRLTREQVGNALYDEGLNKGIDIFVDFLTYAITGGVEKKASPSKEG